MANYLPAESTSASANNILHLNDDCLLAIFSLECISISDLCSIGEAHSRFEQVVEGVFSKRFKNYNLRLDYDSSNEEKRNAKRILSNFGPLILKVTIRGSNRSESEKNRREFNLNMLDWVTEYCSNTMESMKFINAHITQKMKLVEIFNKLKKISLKGCGVSISGQALFANCESLVELVLQDVRFNDQLNALRNTFPKLERFKYSDWRGTTIDFFSYSICKDFFSRHQNLKALRLSRERGTADLIQIITANCKQLIKLDITINRYEKKLNFERALSSIATLGHLNKLRIDCDDRQRNMIKFIEGLKDLNSLDFLELSKVRCGLEMIPALSKLTRVQGLDLYDCRGLTNLNPLADLERLTELKIFSLQPDLDVDIVRVIERLINLKTLHLDVKSFKMDQQTYLRIVDVVRGRSVGFLDGLQITCRTANDGSVDSFAEGDCRKIVRIIKLSHR